MIIHKPSRVINWPKLAMCLTQDSDDVMQAYLYHDHVQEYNGPSHVPCHLTVITMVRIGSFVVL